MIIGEFNESNFDNYEEDSYDYMLRPKSKPTRREKRTVRKENKKSGSLKGKRKHPLLGNFGMFDKNKRKGMAASSDTIKVGVQSADMNVDTPPAADEPEMTPTPSSLPVESAAPSINATSNPIAPASTEAAPDNAEVKLPSNAINDIVASEAGKENQGTVGKTSTSGATPSKEAAKEDVKKGNVKEAGFSSILGFAFLSVAIIAVGFALFRVDKKSNPQPIR